MLPLALILACAAPEPPRPDVVLITLDTTRADALGCYGATPSPTPHVDALAAEGARFAEVLTAAPLTLPAHASLLTGLFPDEHGVRDNNGYHLADAHLTLAERFAGAGYATGAFVAALVLDEAFGLDQGFSVYDDGFDLTRPARQGEVLTAWRRGEEVAGRAGDWLAAQRPEQPLFLWLHLYDPHLPLQPPPEHLERHPDPYLAEVAYADAQIGHLLEALAVRGERARVVAVIADHGEGRGEHGESTHGQFVYRSTMRVPLVIAAPGVPAGLVVQGPRSARDLGPTLLDLAGLDPALGGGASLGPDLAGTGREPGVLYGESLYPRLAYGMSELRVAQDERWRYVLAPRPELYDWRADPGETLNVVKDHPEAAAALRAALEGRVPVEEGHHPADASTRQALASLGYVDGLATVAAEERFDALPDPKDHPDLVARFEALVVTARTRPPDQAVPILEAFLEAHPDVGAARQLLAMARALSGDLEGALSDLEPLVEARPDDALLLARQGELLMELGRHQEARVALERATEANPDFPNAWAILAEVHRREGDCASAVALAERGLAVAPGTSALLLVRGACRLDSGDPTGAEEDLALVAGADPGDAEAAFLLGSALAAQGRPVEAEAIFAALVGQRPESQRSRLALGKAKYQQGAWADARPHLEAAAGRGSGEAHLLLADALLRLGEPPEVVLLHLDAAEALRPGDLQVHRVRSAAYLAQGRTEDALAEIQRAQGH